MKFVKELDVFILHFDWYIKDEQGYFIPTENATDEAKKAMEYCNTLIKRDIDNDMHVL